MCARHDRVVALQRDAGHVAPPGGGGGQRRPGGGGRVGRGGGGARGDGSVQLRLEGEWTQCQ